MKKNDVIKVTKMSPETELKIWRDAVTKLMRVRRIGRNGQPILLRGKEVA